MLRQKLIINIYLLHLVGLFSSYFAHDAQSQEPKASTVNSHPVFMDYRHTRGPITKPVASTTQVYFSLLSTMKNNLSCWHTAYFLFECLWIGINNYYNLFYTEIIIFNTSLGLLYYLLHCFYLAFLAYVLMYLHVKVQISCLVVFIASTRSFSCIIMDWWWPKLGPKLVPT